MVSSRRLAAAVLVLAGMWTADPTAWRRWPQAPASSPREQATFVEFAHRIDAYVDLHRRVAQGSLALAVSTDIGAIRQAMDALAVGIQQRRAGAQPGDIFSPDITLIFRQLVRTGCHEQFLELLAEVTEELEQPLPAPRIHARWPDGAPLPTMNPVLLAALPRLPPELEYRFMNRDLILRDVDADLIVDFITNAIPPTSSQP